MVYEDDGDAWDFPASYRDGRKRMCRLELSQAGVDGPLAVLKQRYRVGESVIDQDVVLASGSRRLEFRTRVDWQETHTMLPHKLSGALRRVSEATCDIPVRSDKKANAPQYDWEQARDKMSAHKWVDISQWEYGVALLNDSKYGYSIRKTSSTSISCAVPTMPDPTADRGPRRSPMRCCRIGATTSTAMFRRQVGSTVRLRVLSVESSPAGTGASSVSLFASRVSGLCLRQ